MFILCVIVRCIASLQAIRNQVKAGTMSDIDLEDESLEQRDNMKTSGVYKADGFVVDESDSPEKSSSASVKKRTASSHSVHKKRAASSHSEHKKRTALSHSDHKKRITESSSSSETKKKKKKHHHHSSDSSDCDKQMKLIKMKRELIKEQKDLLRAQKEMEETAPRRAKERAAARIEAVKALCNSESSSAEGSSSESAEPSAEPSAEHVTPVGPSRELISTYMEQIFVFFLQSIWIPKYEDALHIQSTVGDVWMLESTTDEARAIENRRNMMRAAYRLDAYTSFNTMCNSFSAALRMLNNTTTFIFDRILPHTLQLECAEIKGEIIPFVAKFFVNGTGRVAGLDCPMASKVMTATEKLWIAGPEQRARIKYVLSFVYGNLSVPMMAKQTAKITGFETGGAAFMDIEQNIRNWEMNQTALDKTGLLHHYERMRYYVPSSEIPSSPDVFLQYFDPLLRTRQLYQLTILATEEAAKAIVGQFYLSRLWVRAHMAKLLMPASVLNFSNLLELNKAVGTLSMMKWEVADDVFEELVKAVRLKDTSVPTGAVCSREAQLMSCAADCVRAAAEKAILIEQSRKRETKLTKKQIDVIKRVRDEAQIPEIALRDYPCNKFIY